MTSGTMNIEQKTKDIMKRIVIMRLDVLVVLVILVILGVALASCNVTRTITNESQYYQRGDTSVVIQTKTVETYDASKKL